MGSALDRVRGRKKAAARDIPICMDPELVVRVEKLSGELARVTSRIQLVSGKGQAPDELLMKQQQLEEDLEAAKEAAAADSEWFQVRALAPEHYEKLMHEHQPTKEQIRDARKVHGPKAMVEFNVDTFPDALIQACTYVITFDDPETRKGKRTYEQLDAAFVREMRGKPSTDDEPEDELPAQWSNGEVMALYNACYQINQNASQVNATGNE